MKSRFRAWYASLLVFVFLMSSIAVQSNIHLSGFDSYGNEGMPAPEGQIPSISASENVDSGTKDIGTSTAYPEYMDKVQSSLLERIGGKGHVKVFVATTNVPELARTLSGYDYEGFIGTGAEVSDRILVPLLEIPTSAIQAVAALPDVLSIFEYAPPVRHNYEEMEGLGWDGVRPLNLNSTVHHRADKAWEYNFTGNDVKIAVLDDGVDFSHPDLMGTQARVEMVHYVAGHVVVASAAGGETSAAIKTTHEDTSIKVPNPVVPIVPNSYAVYRGPNKLDEPADYQLDLYTGNITFTSALAPSDKITADFAYYSPYYNWPMAFDPFSMFKFLSSGNALDSWYAPTNTTDKNVTHTIRMDGTNDFWDDGTELVATDGSNDIITIGGQALGNDFDLVQLYVTQDKRYWYIGINSYANQTNMRFAVYINTTVGGADTDPLGNYVNTTPAHRPEFAIYMEHKGLQPYPNWADNDTMENATIYKWDEGSGSWDDGIDLLDSTVGGLQAYSRWKHQELLGFIEMGVPKDYLKDDGNISIIAFTTGVNPSQPQDTVYTDPFPYVNLESPGSNNGAQDPDNALEADNVYASLDSSNAPLEIEGGDFCGNIRGLISKVFIEVTLNQSLLFVNDALQMRWYNKNINGTWHNLTNQIGKRIERFDVKPERSWTWSDFEANDTGIQVNYTVVGGDDGVTVEIDKVNFYIDYVQSTGYQPNLTCTKPKTLTAFTLVGNGYWRHTYTRPGDTIFGVPNANRSWPIEYVLTGTSKSGKYFFGDLPDDNYPQTRLLVVDEAVAGVYDTVYADMDHDKDFGNEKPNKRCGKYDSQMRWHDINWTGPGTVYDENVYSDFFDAAFGVTALDYSPNSSYLASGSNDHNIIIWNVAGALSSKYKYLNAHMGRVTDVEFSPNGLLIASSYDDASGNGDFNAVVWNFATGTIVNAFIGHTDAVTNVAWSPSSTEIATSSSDGTVKIWNVTTNQLVKTFVLGEPVAGVDWSVQNKIAVGVNNTVKFWNSTDNPSVNPLKVDVFDAVLKPIRVASLEFNPNGSWLAVGGHNDLLVIIDVSTGNYDNMDGLGGHSGDATLMSVSWSQNGQWIFSTASRTDIVVSIVVKWAVSKYDDFWVDSTKPTGAHEGDVAASAFSNNGWLATGAKDKMVKIWDPSNMLTISPAKLLVGHAQGSKDYTRYNTGDSLPDVSGGMIYYIATQEIPIPYSDIYTKRRVEVEANLIPANGQLVAFMGALDKAQRHGTLVASAITGTGRSLYHDEQTKTDTRVPNVVGIAPNAKIISIANIYISNFFDGWYFAVEGLDGKPNTGDEADIASNSYGFSTQYADGWHFYDRFADWISLIYAKGRTTFIFSAGNDGYGYGTVTTPGSSTGVITVGATTDFGYRPQSGLEKGPSPSFGDMVTWSSRGPTAMGKPDPDIVANGRMSFGSVALNQIPTAPEYNGSIASEIWTGTSLSAPTLAGILSLAYEAYYKAEHEVKNETLSGFITVGTNATTQLLHAPIRQGSHALYKNGVMVSPTNYALDIFDGTIAISEQFTINDVLTISYRFYNDYPDAMTAKSILMSSADDINYDVLSQGAGFSNAERAVLIASNRSGVLVSPNMWNPGDYKGIEYEAFASFMKPGTHKNMTFSVMNANPTTDVHMNISDAVFKKISEVSYNVVTRLDGEGTPIANWSFIFMTNLGVQGIPSKGVYDLSNLSQGKKRKLADINETVWLDTELLKISAVVNQSYLDPELDGNFEHNYWLDIYDWTLVCPGLPCDYDPELELTGSKDLNRVNMDNPTSNVLEVRVRNPAQRLHDGLGIALRPTLKGDKDFRFKVKLEFYGKTDWNWLDVDSQLVVGGGSTPDGMKSFNASLAVPAGTPIGSYQGGIYIHGNSTNSNETMQGRDVYPDEYVKLQHDNVASAKVWRNTTSLAEGVDYWLYGKTGVIKLAQNVTSSTTITVDYWYQNVTTIPVLVNVPSESVDFSFGANAPGQDEFFNNKVTGGFGNGGQSGDWRFYFVDIPDQGLFAGENMKFYANVTWETNLTDVDVFSFGKGGSNLAAVRYPSNRYGPMLFMEKKGGSEETGAFYTTTKSNREVVLPPLTGGLNVIAIHNVKMSGNLHEERISGEIGMANVNPSELKIVTNKLADSRYVNLYSSRGFLGLNGIAAGPSAPERIRNITIKQDDVAGDFLEALADGGYTKKVTVQKSALIFGANITSLRENVDKPCVDLDLGVFLDGKGPNNIPDGKAIAEELVTYNADQDAEERVKIINPTVEDDPDTPGVNEAVEGAPYLIKVLGFETGGQCKFIMDINLVQGKGFEVKGISQEIIDPFTVATIGISWSLPSTTPDGEFMGAFYIGPYFAPMALLIPIELLLERQSPGGDGGGGGGGGGQPPGVVIPKAVNFEITTAKQINYLNNRTTNDPMPTITAIVKDESRGELDWRSIKLFLDGADITHYAEIDMPFEDPDGGTGPKKYGYWNCLVTYKPPTALRDKPYHLRLEMKDLAGNPVQGEFIFEIDTLAPPLEDSKLFPGNNYRTKEPSILLSGITEPFAMVTVRGTNLTADNKGYFGKVQALEPGVNDFVITAVDWFDRGLLGNPVMANSVTKTIRIIYDAVPPIICGNIDAEKECKNVITSTGVLTNRDFSAIRGYVMDKIGNSATQYIWDSTSVELTINGKRVEVRNDGHFESLVPLNEGLNTVIISARDAAGNIGLKQINITKDVNAPVLFLESIPSKVSSAKILVKGMTEPGSTVLINGKYVQSAGGNFSEDIYLVDGLNIIIIEVFDTAGNVERRSLSVTYSPSPPPTLYLTLPLFLLLLILVFLIGWKIGTLGQSRRKADEKDAEDQTGGRTEDKEESADEERQDNDKDLDATEEDEVIDEKGKK